MSTQEKKGWTWDDEETRTARSWRRPLEQRADELRRRAARFREALPDLAEEAANTARPFLEEAKIVLGLQFTRKYQPLSFEALQVHLEQADAYYLQWTEFLTRPDVAHAILDQHRSQQQAERQYREHLLRQVNHPQALQEQVVALIASFRQGITLLQALHQIDCSPDGLLERLQHVLFIKGAFAGGTIKAASRTAFQHFTEEASIITLDELLGKTIYYLVGDAVARKGSLVPTAPEQIVGIYQREALRSLHALLEDLRKQGASLTSLKPTWFTIYGYDFSTGRRVENPEKRE